MKYRFASILLPAALVSGLASAQAVNDECSTALAINVGPTSFDNLMATTSTPPFACEVVQGQADVWFSFLAPSNGTYVVDLCGSTFDTVLEVMEGTCGSLTTVNCNDDTCGIQSITNFVATAGVTYFIRAGGWGGQEGIGTINIVEYAPVSPPVLAAHYPLNDTGIVATDASGNGQNGTHQNTIVGQPGIAGTSARFDGTSSFVEIFSAPALGPLRFDFTSMAWINVDAAPTSGMRVFGNEGANGSWSWSLSQFGLSATTHAVLDYGANAAAPVVPGTWHHVAVVMDERADVTFYFDGVQLGGVVAGQEFARNANTTWFLGQWAPSNNPPIPQFFEGRMDDVQVYEGQLSAADIAFIFANPGSTLSDGLGSSYCLTNPNSTGMSGTLRAEGSPLIVDNDVTLSAENLPALIFGFFIVSPNQGFVQNPGGSSGNLCVSGLIGRYAGPGLIQQSNNAGVFSLSIDLNAIPSPMGPVMAAPGDTFNFQAWHRDNGPTGSTSNFTDGLEISFF